MVSFQGSVVDDNNEVFINSSLRNSTQKTDVHLKIISCSEFKIGIIFFFNMICIYIL